MTHARRATLLLAQELRRKGCALGAHAEERSQAYRTLLIRELERVDRLRLEVDNWRRRALERKRNG